MNFEYWVESSQHPFSHGEGSYRFRIINTLVVIILMVIILVSPFVIACFYMKHKSKWCYKEDEGVDTTDEMKEEREQFEEKYGTVFEGLRKDKLASLGYTVIFIARRILMMIMCVIPYANYLAIQIFG